MIIIRYKGSKPLHSVLSTREDRMWFSTTVVKSEKVNIIYYDNGIVNEVFKGEPMSAIRRVGTLERGNIPFILLIDGKCNIYDEVNTDLSLINADCVRQADLLKHFKEDTAGRSKSDLFNYLYQEFVDFNSDRTPQTNFLLFSKTAATDDVLTKDLLFIVMSKENGEIFNVSKGLGKFYDGGNIWYFDEMYYYDPAEVDREIEENRIEEFFKEFEKVGYVGYRTLSRYTEDETAEILRQCPKIFSDVIMKSYSDFDKVFRYKGKIKLNDDCEIEETEEECTSEEEYDDYLVDNAEAPNGTKLCFSCRDYTVKRRCQPIVIDGHQVSLCNDCYNTFNSIEEEGEEEDESTDRVRSIMLRPEY